MAKTKHKWVSAEEYARLYPCVKCGKGAWIRTGRGDLCRWFDENDNWQGCYEKLKLERKQG